MATIVRTHPLLTFVVLMLLWAGCDGRPPVWNAEGLEAGPLPSTPVAVETFEQGDGGLADVLFVVDHGPGMGHPLERLSLAFPTLWDRLPEDSHVGVISMDMEEPSRAARLRVGQGVPYTTSLTADPDEVFRAMVDLGTTDSPPRAREAAYRAIEVGYPENEGFYRASAALHLVFVSNSDDASSDQPLSHVAFQAWIEDLKGEPGQVGVHAITVPFGATCVDGPEWGAAFELYTGWTGGVRGDLCELDWTDTLAALGERVSGLSREFVLDGTPAVDGVLEAHVTRNGVSTAVNVCLPGMEIGDASCDAVYVRERNSIQFIGDSVPLPSSEIQVAYTAR